MKEEQRINGLPKDWKVVRLGDYAKTEKGKKPKAVSKEPTKEFSIPYVNIKAFEQNIIDEYTNGVGCVLCEDDDFLMVWDGSRSGYVGKAIKGALGSTLVKIKLPEVDHDFAYFFLQSKFVEINSRAKGVGIPHVDPTLVWNYSLPLPPKEIQQQIVSKIEELFSELDKGIEELKTAQQQLKVYRQAVLKWAFEGRLTNEDVKDGELPEGWKNETLGKIAKFINGDRGKNYPNRNEYVEKGVAFINTGHIEPNGKLSLTTMHYLTREKFNSLNSGKIIKGDLVYCLRGATLGKTAIVDQFDEGAIASSLVIIRLNREISNRFVYYFLTGPIGRDNIFRFDNGSAQPNLSAKSVTLYKIPIPSFDEQQKVVQEIESRLSVCDKIEETITDSLKQAEALRQSILKKAFEGKLAN